MPTIDTQKQLAINVHSEQAEEFSERYDLMAQDAYSTVFTYSRKRLNAYLNRYLPADATGLRLLDIGCGTGHQMMEMRERGFEVAGIDGSDEMLDRARANNPGAPVEQADVEALPFPDASFDYILCIEVLRYLPDSRGAIREMARVLKPGGVALVTAIPPLNLNGYFVINRLATALPQKSLTRLKQFFNSSRSLRRMFQQAGFARPTIHGVYAGPLNWISRLAPGQTTRFLQNWERLDDKAADASLREFANMFLIRAVRKGAKDSSEDA